MSLEAQEADRLSHLGNKGAAAQVAGAPGAGPGAPCRAALGFGPEWERARGPSAPPGPPSPWGFVHIILVFQPGRRE